VEKLARAGLDRKGVSEVVATVMLVTVTLGMIVGGVFFAQLNLSMQAQATEFENGKASMISLAKTIESLVTGGKGTASYVQFNINSGGLALTSGNERLTITVNGETLFTDTVNLIRFRGGAGVSSSQYVVLRGVSTGLSDEHMRHLIVSPEDPAPLGWVYLTREKGAWVVADFGRARVVASGAIRLTVDGMNYTTVNTVEITYIRIVWGRFSGSNTYDVCTRVINVTTTIKKFESSSVTVSVERGGYSEPYSVSDEDAKYTLVFLTVVNVEVSMW
jgi:hypothetical protein